MADYQAMCFKLFNKMTEVIEDLQTVQQQVEEMYMLHDVNVACINEKKC